MGKGNVGTLHAERGLANHVPLFQTVDRRILEVQALQNYLASDRLLMIRKGIWRQLHRVVPRRSGARLSYSRGVVTEGICEQNQRGFYKRWLKFVDTVRRDEQATLKGGYASNHYS